MSAAIVLLLLGDAVLRSGWGTMALLAPWPLLALWGVYVGVYVSAVTTDAAGLRVQNLMRITQIPWGQVAGIDLRYQLVITLRDGRRLTCFGGPATARPSVQRRRDEETPRVSAAARDLQRLRDDWEAAGAGTGGVVTRRWDIPALAALAAIAVWAVIAVLIAFAR